MKILLNYQKFFEASADDLLKETQKFESEVAKKLNFLQSAEGNWTNYMAPDFSADKIKKDKDLLNCFFFTRPCQKMIVGKVVEFTKKLVELTNIETMMNYYSILFSYRDKIEELYKKLDKAKDSSADISSLSKDYKQWVTSLDYIKSEVDKDDFAKKIIPDEDLVVSYNMKDNKGQAKAEITKIDVKDDGTVEFTLDNEKVGEVKKGLDDLVVKGENQESNDEVDLQKKMTDLIKAKPEEVKRILKFTNFISDEKNKDQVVQITKILGI